MEIDVETTGGDGNEEAGDESWNDALAEVVEGFDTMLPGGKRRRQRDMEGAGDIITGPLGDESEEEIQPGTADEGYDWDS